MFVSGGPCLELIRFGNRIGTHLIVSMPEIDWIGVFFRFKKGRANERLDSCPRPHWGKLYAGMTGEGGNDGWRW